MKTSRDKSEWYFKPRAWEKPVYKILASRTTSLLAKRTVLGILNIEKRLKHQELGTFSDMQKLAKEEKLGPNYSLKGNTAADIAAFEHQTKINEVIHLTTLPLFALLFGLNVSAEQYAYAALEGTLLFGSIPVIFAARWQRSRVREVAGKKLQSEKDKKTT